MFPPCVCVFRCGTTLLPRQPRTGLTPAFGSTARLTSSGSWVKTSLSGQAGEWPLTPLTTPTPTSAAPLRDDSPSLRQQSWSLALQLPSASSLWTIFFFHMVTQWLLEECSHDPSNKQKLCFQPWPMRAKTHLFSGSFLTFRSEMWGTLMCFTLLGFTEEWYETQGRSAQSSWWFTEKSALPLRKYQSVYLWKSL